MKKIIILLFCLVFSQGNMSAQNINELLERLAASADHNLKHEPADLFTFEEKQILRDYLELTNPVMNDSKAFGDVYAVSIYGGCNCGYGTFPIAGPFNMNFKTSTETLFYAGDYDSNGNLYGVSMDFMDENPVLINIDPATGAETVIGPLTNLPASHFPTGLAWNYSNQTMYALSSNSDTTQLYTVDLNTGTLTLIGITGNTTGSWLAIDNFGNAFMMDVRTDYLYSVNLTTAAATIVGATGVDLGHAQDADFDPATGILYAAGYIGTGVNRIYSVNTTTGFFTSKGSVNNDCAELGLFSISGIPSSISENPLDGFSFYPNPSEEIINLISTENIESVCIYNLLGVSVLNFQDFGAGSQLNVSDLSTGTYHMKVIVNGKTGVYKIIKK